MSFEAEWEIAGFPGEEELAAHVAAICDAAGLPAARVERKHHVFALTWEVPVAGAAEIAGRLGCDLPRGDIERDLVAPGAAPFYTLLVDVLDGDGDDDLHPLVRVDSLDADNRAGWPVACEIGLALAERCGLYDEEAN